MSLPFPSPGHQLTSPRASAAQVAGVPVATKIVEPRLTLVLNVAFSSLTPAAGPNVQLPTIAMPFTSVTSVGPVMLPPPAVTLKVTCTPATA